MKNKYRELCNKEKSIPIFNRDWWLDAVCGENNWNVVIAEKNGNVIGALPYYLARGPLGLSRIVMPKLTQHNGLWIKYPNNQNYIDRLSYEKEIMYSIIEQIDNLNVAYFSQHFHYSITNWLPFLWKGFNQTTRYSYVIEDLSNLDKVYAQFEKKKRTYISKAGTLLRVKYNLSMRDFYEHHKQTLAKSGAKINYPYVMLNRLLGEVYKRGQGISMFCVDSHENIHGAKLIVWDENSAYQLIGSYDPDFRNSGVSALLAWEAIKYAASRTRQFDFVGSMVEAYERPYRGFGGRQKPYFNISKTYSPMFMMRDGFNQFMNGLKQTIKNLVRGK
jgi:hypothetical protein